jgi:hypothetical protein
VTNGPWIAADERGRAVGQLSCPKCSGIAKSHRGFLFWLLVVLLFPIGLALLLLKPTYTCKSCGFAFKP